MRVNFSRWCLALFLSLLPALASAQNTSMTATVSFLKGNAVAIDASGKERTLKVGDQVVEKETIRLDTKKSKLFLKVSDGTDLRLAGKTQLSFAEFNHTPSGLTRKTRLELAFGRFWSHVAKLTSKTSRFEVKAGGVICGVRGTTIGGETDGQGHTTFYNFEGNVFIDDGSGNPQSLPPGTHITFDDGKPGQQQGNDPGDSQFFQDGDAGGDNGTAGTGGSDEVMDVVAGTLNETTGNAGDDNQTGLGNEQSNAALQVQLNAPEGAQ